MVECLSVNFKFDVAMALAKSTKIMITLTLAISFAYQTEKPARKGTIFGITMLIGPERQFAVLDF
jgi:hypothetical protein